MIKIILITSSGFYFDLNGVRIPEQEVVRVDAGHVQPERGSFTATTLQVTLSCDPGSNLDQTGLAKLWN